MDLEDSNFSWRLFAVIVGVLVVLLVINYVGFSSYSSVDSSSFDGELVVLEKDKPFMTVKLGSDPAFEIFSAAQRCFSSDLSDFSSCAVVDPSGLTGVFGQSVLYEPAASLNLASLNGELPGVVGEFWFDWQLEDSISSLSEKFFLCTGVARTTDFNPRSVSVVLLTRDAC